MVRAHDPDQPTLFERISKLLIILLLIGTVAVEVVVPFASWRWMQQPFLGLLFEQTLVAGGMNSGAWGLGVPEDGYPRLRAVNGQPVETGRDLNRVLQDLSVGEQVTLLLQPQNGPAPDEVQVVTQEFPLGDWLTLFWLPYIIGLVYLGIGLWVFRHRGDRRPGQSFALLCAFVALGTSTIFDLNTTYVFSRIWTAAIPFTAAALLHLALVFPEEGPLTRRLPWTRFFPYLIAIVLILVAQLRLYDLSDPWAYITTWRWNYAALGVSILAFFGLMLYARARTLSGVVRQQVRIILLGGLLSFIPMTMYMVLAGIGVEITFQPALYLSTVVIFPLFIAYAILRYKLLGMDLVISRGLAYTILVAIVAGAYFLMLTVLGQAWGLNVANNPLLLALFVVILIFILNPLREGAENLTDRLLGRRRHDYRQALQTFSHELVGTPLELPAILNRLLAQIEPVSHSAPALIVLYDPRLDCYTVHQSSGFVIPQDLDAGFDRDSRLARWLSEQKQYLYLQDDEAQRLVHKLSTEEAQDLERLGLVLFFPLRGKERLDGWVALGPRLSGEPYSPDDLAFLAALADQTAIAIENAQLLAQARHRADELVALQETALDISGRQESQVLLHSIVERATRLLGATGGDIALIEDDPAGEQLRVVVSYNLDRDYAGTILRPGEGVTGQVALRGQPLRVEDYRQFEHEAAAYADAPIRSVLGVPLNWHDEVLGVLTIVDTDRERQFTEEDEWLLSLLASQAAIALWNAQIFADLEQRVLQMDVLRQISEAVDLRRELEDLLGLIYEQTSRIMEVDNFYVALYDEDHQEFHFAYYVEERERRQPQDATWPLGTGLTSQIVRQRQPIVTDDYLAECERRGISFSGKPAQAWLGVPLMARNRPLGVLNISSFQPGYRYAQEQVQLMSAIADQAAQAIDRMRLYQEMEARAAELATLNEVNRTINSTLDLPSVLDLIMNKVVELLVVEAGSLLLLDEESGNLVFEVALGTPSSETLLGRHQPADQGIAGHVMQSGQAQIVNDVQADPRWDQRVDKDIEFITHSILCVPMISREQVVGVIEVINHLDGRPFAENEANLLTGFAAQAAVAIENARLYTQTDLALARRVDELSTMQRIDRELNATLEFDRVMDMTLDWALRGTETSVGVITLYDESWGGMLLLAMRGYLPEYERYRKEPWPLDDGISSRVIRTGEPALVHDVQEDVDYHPAQPSTRSQLTVPIRREQRVVGVVNVESSQVAAFDEDDQAFLQRLADHAAIAIENARLYRESQRRAEDMTLLYDISLTVSSHLALDEVLEAVYERIQGVWNPPVFFIALYDEEEDALDFPISVDREGRLEPFHQSLTDQFGFSAWIVRNCQPILIRDWLKEAETSPVQGIVVGDVTRSWLGVPLLVGDRMVGVMAVQDYAPNVYGEEHQRFLSTIAGEVAIAIDNARLYQQAEQYARELAARAERLALVNRISTAVNSTLDLDHLLQTATREMAKAFQVKQAGTILFDHEAGYGLLIAEYREGESGAPAEVRVPLHSNPSIERVIATRQPLAIEDVHNDPLTASIRDVLESRDIESILITPLVVKDNIIGTIGLDAIGAPRAFTPVEIDLAQTIANQVGLAVENVRLYQETQQRLREVTLLFDTSTAVSKSLDLDRVLHTTAEQITTALAADGCAISLWNREEDTLMTLLDYSSDPDWWQPEAQGTVYALDGHPASQQVLTDRQPLMIHATAPRADSAELSWMVKQDVKSLLMVPLVVRDESVGLLELMQTSAEREFEPTEIRLCQTLANQAAAALENARLYEGVKAADQAKSEFIDFVAHELKQPMTAMQGYAKMLIMGIGGELSDTQNQFVEVITSNVDRMGKLVNDLLEISRLEAGRTQLKLAPIPLNEVVEETVTNTRTEIEARQHTLEIDLPDDLPPVLGDRERLVQILTNLVSNAYKYTPEGGTIRIAVNGQDGAKISSNQLLVSVSDTGIGMSPQELANLDKKFFRADHDLVRAQPGTGLGVSITRNLVELHGGEFMIESEENKGSTFSFTVPIAGMEDETP